MHQIVLFTALTATTGFWGAPRSQCPTGNCPNAAPASYSSYYSAPAPAYNYGYQAPVYAPAPQAYYAPQAPAYAAPQPAAPRMAYYPTSYSAPAAAQPSCATGNCPRR